MIRGPTSSVTINSALPLESRTLFFQPRYSTFSTVTGPFFSAPTRTRDMPARNMGAGRIKLRTPRNVMEVPPDSDQDCGADSAGGAVAGDVPAWGAAASCGNSLLPTTVMLRPICTATGVPSISTLILLLRYQPSDPVENSRAPASRVCPAMVTGMP